MVSLYKLFEFFLFYRRTQTPTPSPRLPPKTKAELFETELRVLCFCQDKKDIRKTTSTQYLYKALAVLTRKVVHPSKWVF